MGKYIKVFDNHSDYNQFIILGEAASPNVSYCVQEKEVHYNPEIFASEYFTTVARENGTIDFILFSWADTSYVERFAYSKNDGEWVETQNSDGRKEDITISVSVVKGDKVRWKGIANHIGDDGDNGGAFISTCRFDVQGNIMSLLYGDDFKGKITLENGNEFSSLFYDMNNGNGCLVVNASNLILPATTLEGSCYNTMFYNCTSLTTAPELPAATLAEYCYQGMFNGCTNLNYIKAMFTTTPGTGYTNSWVSGVASTGTFVKNSAATWTTTGVNGIPTGWTVQTANE